MTKQKATKRALLMSALSILLCVSMLIGTTYAWFTDSVTSAGNIIKSGTLDVEMYWAEGEKDVPAEDSADWKDASTTKIFDYDKWEPGYVTVRHIKIANEGTLALKYQLAIVADGIVSELADVIDVYFVDPAAKVADRTALTDANKVDTLTNVLKGMPANMSGELLEGQNDTVTIALKMQEEAGNEYQDKSIGATFAVQLLATQLTAEKDSFDDQYDKDAGYNQGKTNVGPYKLNVLSGGNAVYDEATNTYNVAVATVAQGGYNATQGGKYYAGYTVNVEGYGEGATVSFDKNGTEVVWKLADEERDGFINNGIHQQWTSVGIARAYRYDIDGDGVTDFTVYNDASEAKVEVANAEELKKTIINGVDAVLVNDIVMNNSASLSNADFVLDGNGHTITMADGATNTYALFDITGGKATIKDVTFDGIKEGAIVRTVGGVEFNADNVTAVNGNHTQVQGIFRLLGKSTITNCTFKNNTCNMVISLNYDGANNDPQVVKNCVFENNTCNATGVLYYVKGASCTLDGNKFVGNTVNCNGNGATVYMGFTENNTITNNVFKNNVVKDASTSKRVAGALMVGYETVITNNAFIDNKVEGTNAKGNDVCASVYYTDIDLSGNYWGGEAPVENDNYFVEYPDNNNVIINDYLTTYSN